VHDPLTQAFSISNPFSRTTVSGDKYRKPLITIWHKDPLKFEGKICHRDDDSCGWLTPPYSPDDRDKIEKLSKEQYRQIFAYQVATTEGKDYAYICNKPDCQSAIYWSWRAIKHLYKPSEVWQYGCKLTSSEKERIYELATSPVSNLYYIFRNVKNEESFNRFFFLIFQAYLRHSRPWYKHPRWHFWHWKIQIHPVQVFKRWAFSRCAGCGKRFSWGYAPTTGSWNSEGPMWFRRERNIYHSECYGKEAYVSTFHNDEQVM
jgi:hypothetical protein